MNWKDGFGLIRENKQKLWRGVLALGCPAAIIWLGGDALYHINDLYDGLCVVQGSGMRTLLYSGDRLGYCSGIGSYLSTLSLIMWVAALAVPIALVGYWHYADRSRR